MARSKVFANYTTYAEDGSMVVVERSREELRLALKAQQQLLESKKKELFRIQLALLGLCLTLGYLALVQ